MCGRFSLTSNHDELSERFGLVMTHKLTPRWNIAPSQSSLIITANGFDRTAMHSEFGLKTSVSESKRLINARSETVAQKPTFREAFTHARCLVVASGWYEWSVSTHIYPGHPYHIQLLDGRVMAFAGLWFSPKDISLSQFVILTISADGPLRELHHRCPLVLPSKAWSLWLAGSTEDAQNCLISPKADYFNAYPVSRDVGDVRCDHAGLVAPVVPQRSAQTDLFNS